MRSVYVRILVTWLSLSLVACSSLRAVPDWKVSPAAEKAADQNRLKVGEDVIVTTTNKGPIELVFSRMEPDALVGTSAGSEVRVPIEEVSGVEVRRFDGWKTALLGLVLVVTSLAWGLSHMVFMSGG